VLNELGEIAAINDFESLKLDPFAPKVAADFLGALAKSAKVPLSQPSKRIGDMTTDEFNQLVDNFITREDDRIEPSALLKEIIQVTLTTTEEIYEQIVKPLPAAERLRSVGKIVYDLSIEAVEDKLPERHDWMSLRGVAPDLSDGEDA